MYKVRILVVVALACICFRSIAADRVSYHIDEPLADANFFIGNLETMAAVEQRIATTARCAGLYWELYNQLKDTGLEKRLVSPFARSSIIVSGADAILRSNLFLAKKKAAGEHPSNQSLNEKTKELSDKAEFDAQKFALSYSVLIRNFDRSGNSVLRIPAIKNDLKICNEALGDLAPDASCGTAGKLPCGAKF